MLELDPDLIARQAQEAHERSMRLVEGLSSDQLMGPVLATVNPLRWEIGHAAYFYEYWVLRQHLKHAAIRKDADDLYDSISIAHDDRWGLPLPAMAETLEYAETVLKQVKSALASGADARRDYLAQYAVFHQDMHNEAYTYTRQTLNYPAPKIARKECVMLDAGGLNSDVHIPGGDFML